MATDVDVRVERLTRHRRDVGQAKEEAALQAVESLVGAGECVTFAGVQRTAGVSSWFVYNNARVRTAVETARQASIPARSAAPDRASTASLRADLELARAEIADLRGERDRLRSRLRRELGAALERRDPEALTAQVQELQRAHTSLTAELQAVRIELRREQEQVALLIEDRDAARAALRRMVREQSAAAHG